VALAILIIASVVTLPVFLLGEPAEEIVEHLPGISEDIIEEHEEAAELALWVSLSSGVLGIATWIAISAGARLERALLALTFIVASVSSALLGYTAHQGGKIRHPEAFERENAPLEGSHVG
jgi:uncharacterized membrane protein